MARFVSRYRGADQDGKPYETMWIETEGRVNPKDGIVIPYADWERATHLLDRVVTMAESSGGVLGALFANIVDELRGALGFGFLTPRRGGDDGEL